MVCLAFYDVRTLEEIIFRFIGTCWTCVGATSCCIHGFVYSFAVMSQRVLILGDSLIRHLPDNNLYRKVFYPGINCDELSEKISLGELDHILLDTALVILVIGTNDIPLYFPERVARKISSTALVIKGRKRSITVAVAGILPRPGDNNIYNTATKLCNKSFETLIVGTGILPLRSYRALLNFNTPRLTHYLPDGLHLNAVGIRVLYRGFMSHMHRLLNDTS